MAFNFSAGLSLMGESISKTSGVLSIEAQKAEAQREMLALADQMAGVRESRGRAEAHGYGLETLGKQQEFTGKENQLNRDSADRHNAASVGASMSNAQLAASTQKEIAALGVKARSEEHDKTIAATLQAAAKIQIGEDGTAYSLNPATNKIEPFKVDGEPLKFRDPDVAKAQVELLKTRSTQLRDVTQTYLPQIQSLEATLRKMQTEMIPGDKNAQKELSDVQARLKATQDRLESEKAPIMHELNEIARNFAAKGKVATTPGPGGRAPLADLITIPGSKPPSGMPEGLIDTPRPY